MYPGHMGDYMGWMMFGSILIWIALLAAAVYLVVRLTRPLDQATTARSILDERLARGEIAPEEYRSRIALLKG